MLKVYYHRNEDDFTKLSSEAFSWDEAIQFIRILVSVHGYDFRDINQHDVPEEGYTKFDGYAPDEFCYVMEEIE